MSRDQNRCFFWSVDEILEKSGSFLQDCVIRPIEQGYAKGREHEDKLWALSEKLVGRKFDL